jgi:hypothetical protein
MRTRTASRSSEVQSFVPPWLVEALLAAAGDPAAETALAVRALMAGVAWPAFVDLLALASAGDGLAG